MPSCSLEVWMFLVLHIANLILGMIMQIRYHSALVLYGNAGGVLKRYESAGVRQRAMGILVFQDLACASGRYVG